MAKKKRKPYIYKSDETRAKAQANFPRNQEKTLEEIEAETVKYQDTKKRLQEINIIEFAEDPDYLNLSFEKRPVQKIILKALYGLPLDKKELKIFKILTKGKGKYTPGREKLELIACLGARSGKSFLVSICACFEATRDKWKKEVLKGENVYIVIIATRELQAKQIIGKNCKRMFENSPLLSRLIEKTTDLELTLKNDVKIIAGPCTSASLRGLPIAVLILDEIAFFRLEGVTQDETIFGSLLVRQAQFEFGKYFLISTAGSKQGLFFQEFDKGFRQEDRLTIQADTRFVNPEIPQKFLNKEKARNYDNWRREFQAEFSEKLEAFFSLELMQRPFVLAGDLSYESEYKYHLGLDQSGLSGKDRFALAIAHKEEGLAVVDVVRSWETKDLDIILDEIEKLAITYHLTEISIDRYSKGYVENSFRKIGLTIKIRPSLADVFVVLKAKMIQDKLQLPDRPDIRAGLKNTIAIYNKSNKLTIFHERGPEGHADEIDAVAGAVFELTEEKEETTTKALEGRSDKVKNQGRMGRNRRLSSQYDDEMREENEEDWGGASDTTTPRIGDW